MPKRILIVDDDRGMVHNLKDILEKHGFEIVTAVDGVDAFHIIKTNSLDLLIIDLKMPDMDGWHFILKIRNMEQYSKTPIIVLSGLLRGDSEPEQFDSINAYMAKPFDVIKMVDKIKELLNAPA